MLKKFASASFVSVIYAWLNTKEFILKLLNQIITFYNKNIINITNYNSYNSMRKRDMSEYDLDLDDENSDYDVQNDKNDHESDEGK